MSLGAAYCVYNACDFLPESVQRIYPVVDRVVFLVNFSPWFGEPFSAIQGTLKMILDIPDPGKKFGILAGHWKDEAEQRNAGLSILRENGIDWCLIVDDDELYNPGELERVKYMLENNSEHAAYLIYHQIYWKDRETIIEGIFGSFPTIASTNGTVNFNENRMIKVNSGHTWFSLSPESILCHHMSYVRSDIEMKRKIESFSHADEVVPDWYERVWLGGVTVDLHPSAGPRFKRALRASESKYKLQEIEMKQEIPSWKDLKDSIVESAEQNGMGDTAKRVMDRAENMRGNSA